MPRWWLWTFYATIVWAIGYIDRLSGVADDLPATTGACSAIRVAREVEERARAPPRPPQAKLIVAIQVDDRRRQCRDDAELLRIRGRRRRRGVPGQLRAMPRRGRARARRAIPTSTTTTGCGAATLEQIEQTITHGIRFAPIPTRAQSQMPAFGATAS